MADLLDIRHLTVSFAASNLLYHAVHDVSFSVQENEILGLVGESGSGKSQLMLSILRLQANTASISGQVFYKNDDLLRLQDKRLRMIRANDIAMIFQDPMSALNPYLRIGKQLTESLTTEQKVNSNEAKRRAIDVLDKVRIPDARQCMNLYPHQLSGGMRQRVMIAMALLRKPKILIADEPTTALDVTVQSEILSLLHTLKDEYSLSIVLITHDMSIVAGLCDRVMVMYAGNIVEIADTSQLFSSPKHPYTQGLLQAAKSQTGLINELYSIPGQPSGANAQLSGCVFYERCDQRLTLCRTQRPVLEGTKAQRQACHLYNSDGQKGGVQ